MPRFAVIFSTLSLVLLLLSGCGGGGGGPVVVRTGTLAGLVQLPPDTAVQGAAVRVQGTTMATSTDASGHFELTNIPVGTHTLVISYPGYQSQAVSATVQADITTTLPAAVLAVATRKWTVLVFMNADNDLEEFGVLNVNQMESVPDHDQIAVAVQMDRSPSHDTTNGNWTEAKRFLIRHDDDMAVMNSPLNSPVLESLGEIDMGKASTLQDFITWGKEHFPAEHTLLVVWNHGSGWRSSMANQVTRGISFDDTSSTHIPTVEMPAALATSPPFDIIAFDASLMQMAEIAYEIRNTCQYLVGSEESPPGAGYPYQTFLGDLASNPEMSPRDFADDIARRTRDYYDGVYGVDWSNITHSVIDTGQMPYLAMAIDTFAGTLIGLSGSEATNLTNARMQAESYKFSEYKDLYHYAELVKDKVGNAAVDTAADELMTAINSAVIAEYHGRLHPNSHGISINIPSPVSYLNTSLSYQALALSNATRWDNWLGKQPQ